jgi:hypothetical protein
LRLVKFGSVWRVITRLLHPAQLFVATDLRVAIICEEAALENPRYLSKYQKPAAPITPSTFRAQE